ncbi:DUF2141 domain-containing protein [Sphingobium algorifonticola]|uniref:DUF2141 domain-containing protein n=1 Tax=Sphingobium algorifonticola TaxID=2008318 RepID=A0A437JCL0_9SPHN|nr:DUF2141 domain-containing protein [Sphingobium algorifonticola]RVT43668.1 DUF2141 domain-containing protein [Sphingobium algorifonticola]
MSAVLPWAIALIAAATPIIPSTPDLGKAEARCRPGESGPSFLLDIVGLKDRQGKLKVEVYPANDRDFLQDDNILIAQGKTFRRVEVPVQHGSAVQLCVRVPGPGRYAVTVLHDRDANRKFGLSVDGVGFGGNPKLGMGKPKAAAATIIAGNSPTRERIVMNYRRGLLSFGPIRAL